MPISPAPARPHPRRLARSPPLRRGSLGSPSPGAFKSRARRPGAPRRPFSRSFARASPLRLFGARAHPQPASRGGPRASMGRSLRRLKKSRPRVAKRSHKKSTKSKIPAALTSDDRAVADKLQLERCAAVETGRRGGGRACMRALVAAARLLFSAPPPLSLRARRLLPRGAIDRMTAVALTRGRWIKRAAGNDVNARTLGF